MSFLYIASRTKMGGIYKYAFDGRHYEQRSFCPVDSPMYMIATDHTMHILLREPFDNKESGYVRYTIQENGDLNIPSPILSTKGQIACHLYVEQENIYCVNYTSGSVIKLPDTLVVHDSVRQSHTHYVGPTPDGKYLCVTDLGLDQIFLYDRDLNLINRVAMPLGCGVRHLVFAENNYIFSANELNGSVSALHYENGTMRLVDTVSCIDNQVKEVAAPSAIRMYKGKVYVAVRGCNTISCLSFCNDKLKLQNSFDCQGQMPRDFCFDENRLICCNQESDTVTIFQETNGSFNLIQTIQIEEPICSLTN